MATRPVKRRKVSAPKKAKPPIAPPSKNLTKLDIAAKQKSAALTSETRRRQRFVKEYLIDLNGRCAAIRAGYAEANARTQASELLAIPALKAAVDAAIEKRAAKLEITAEKVLARMWAIATADSAELIELQHGACRYCWGLNHRYQWTPRELQAALRDFAMAQMEAESKGLQFSAEFDQAGGLGFDPRRDPNSKCPECFGRGVDLVVPKDVRDLSPTAKLLYAGVKTTKDGLEIKAHDQAAMLVNVGKHLGMFQTKVEHSNNPDHPMPGYVFIPAKKPHDGG